MRSTNRPYPFVRRWGEMMGSHSSFVADEVARAIADKAPPTAIYKRGDAEERATGARGWATIEEVTNMSTRHYFTARGWMKPDWTLPD